MNDKLELTKSVILKPLREALEEHKVNEDSVITIFHEIMTDKEAPHAVRLNAVKMFLNMIGLVNEGKQTFDLEITHKISDALGELEEKRLQRVENKRLKQLEAPE